MTRRRRGFGSFDNFSKPTSNLVLKTFLEKLDRPRPCPRSGTPTSSASMSFQEKPCACGILFSRVLSIDAIHLFKVRLGCPCSI